jgi:transcriptional regulator with XRE-family HTH domain
MLLMSNRPKRPILKANGESFGERLRRLRKAQGLTQGELGEVLGVSVRAICSYECDECQPPANILVPMAKQLNVGMEELMGITAPTVQKMPALQRRWARKFDRIQGLPERQQRAIMQVLDMALKANS